MLLKDVIGQQKAKEQLLDTVRQDRISHAQLFLGAEGSGNLPLAIAYAQYVSCENRQETDSCGKCPSCVKYSKLAHPDLHFVFPVATTPSVKSKPVSDNFLTLWRDKLLENPYFNLNQWLEHIGVENKQGLIGSDEAAEIIKKLNLKTYEAEYKVMIIWMPEKMNAASANKLLKMIEEPPKKTLFLLVAENAEMIINTILSRTQLVKVPKIDRESLQTTISERFGIAGDNLLAAVRLSNGNYIKALEAVERSASGKEFFDTFTNWMRTCYSGKVLEISKLIDSMTQWGRERQKSFLNYAMGMVRENFVMNLSDEGNSLNYMNSDENMFSERFHRFINERNIFQINAELELAYKHIERNASDKIVLLDLSLKLINLLRS